MASSVGHQSPQSTLPPLAQHTVNSQTWLAQGTTDTVTDAYCHSNSMVLINPQTVPAGRWAVVTSQGSFTVTSSDTEQTTCIYEYIIL